MVIPFLALRSPDTWVVPQAVIAITSGYTCLLDSDPSAPPIPMPDY